MSKRTRTSRKGEKRGSSLSTVRVSVHYHDGRLYDRDARVTLRRSRHEPHIVLDRKQGAIFYEGKVIPDSYLLWASADRLQSPIRDIEVSGSFDNFTLYLGESNWPFYRLGENKIPFEPREDLLAIAFDSRVPSPSEAEKWIDILSRKLPLRPFELNKDSAELSNTAAEGAIWLFQFTNKHDVKGLKKLHEFLRSKLHTEARVGIPVDLKAKQVKVLDNRFVIRFRDHLKPFEIEALVKRVKGRILRELVQAGNARLIEFISGDYRDHLGIVEEWYQKGLLVYGEPDLLAEITDDVFPADPPNDPTYPNQLNLTLQNVGDAWRCLNGISSNITLGDTDVYVATIDRGVDIDHPDIGGNLTDGTSQLAVCYDFSGLRSCEVPGYAPDSSHGMGVYGIIAALTTNNTCIAGIAPNTHQIAIERPSLTSVNYADVLLWAAGFITGNPSIGWPLEPISPAADIISCSHGVDGLPLSGIMDDTLKYLATYGRDGRGTLVIYSAGNSGTLITGFRTWAAHPRTLAISNSLQPDNGGIERLEPTSNYGPEIDICAQGEGAPSLNDTGGEQIFGGTSAAAPIVAAVASLMLSAESNLTWINLRDIFRNTAVRIDPANTDPIGQWVNGFSQWYGFGRLDANGALFGADSFDTTAINLVMRDNVADTGVIVPTGGAFWRSPDLWVRNSDPSTDPIGDPIYSVDPPHQAAIAGQNNWIRVRVKNVGTAVSGDFYVRVYLTHFAGTEFRYPTDFIPSVNSGDPIPSPLVQSTYMIGEIFTDSLAADTTRIYNFLWPANMVPPEFIGGARWHPCLLAEISPHTGPPPTGDLVVDYTNLAQRNITIDYSADDGSPHEALCVLGHEDDDMPVKRINIHRSNLPKKSKVMGTISGSESRKSRFVSTS